MESARYGSENQGTYGIVSLMVDAVLQAKSGVLYPATDALGPNDTVPANFISTDPIQGRVMLATVLSLLTGIIHVSSNKNLPNN